MSGVERWATEVIPRLHAHDPARYRVLAPPPALRSRGAGQAWEQFILPLRAARLRASLVFSPANLAPLPWPRNVVVVHDAAVLRHADAYSLAYRLLHHNLGVGAARRALMVVTVSQFSRAELALLTGIDVERIAVIPGAADSRFRPDASSPSVAERYALKDPYVLTVGTDDRRKNFHVLGRAALRLREVGVELVWAGGARPHLAQEHAIAGLRPLGYVDERDLPALYAGARAFVMPSRYEGFGLPCLEAMACGIPVVASNAGALPELCQGAAVLVDPEDGEEIANALARVTGEEALRARLRDAGLRRAAQFSWDRTAEAVHRLLNGLIRVPR